MPFLKLTSATLHYETLGLDEAPPLVLLHGATDTFRSAWNKQIGPFSERFRVIGVDLRGHGRSDNPDDALDLRRMADDVAELLAALGYLTLARDAPPRLIAVRRRVHACGFSGGGNVALYFAQRHAAAVQSLVLVSNTLDRDDTRLAGDFWDPERMLREQPGWWKHMEQSHQTDPETLLRWWAHEDSLRPDFTPEALAHIDAPVLVIGGDRDPITPLEQTLKLYRALPKAQLAILPGIGHSAPTRGAALFNPLVADFIARHSGA